VSIISCAGCGRQTNTAVAEWLDQRREDGKAHCCYAAWVDGKWVKGCAYDKADPVCVKPFVDRLLAGLGFGGARLHEPERRLRDGGI